jgi:hypothetical protein
MLTSPTLTIKPGYKSQSDDATNESDALGFWLLRQRSHEERLSMGASLNRSARQFSLNCLRKRFSRLSQQEFSKKVAEAWLQENYPSNYVPSGDEMTWIQDSIGLAGLLHSIFESLEIPYYVTGGVAAIAYGEPRTTQDLDVVLSIQVESVGRLASTLESAGFYVPGVDDIISGRMKTLQVTNMNSIARADLVIATEGEFEEIKFSRRQQYQLPDGTEVYLSSPEDLILNKLRWGKQADSQKQWRDVLGVLKVQAENLDFTYLIGWANRLDVLNDLNRATIEAGLEI